VLFILNTFGILEIIYIFMIAKKSGRDILNLFNIKTNPADKKESSDQEKNS
jgi:uncharacterized protein DUF5652